MKSIEIDDMLHAKNAIHGCMHVFSYDAQTNGSPQIKIISTEFIENTKEK